VGREGHTCSGGEGHTLDTRGEYCTGHYPKMNVKYTQHHAETRGVACADDSRFVVLEKGK
jgi:hypothetical protein